MKLGNQMDPELIPTYEKVYLKTSDSKLQPALARALKIVQKKPNAGVYRTLATYNTDAAIETVISYAMDESCPFRTEAIQALFQYAGLWEDKISKHITKLLTDVSPREKLLIIEYLLELGDAWKTLTHLKQKVSTGPIN